MKLITSVFLSMCSAVALAQGFANSFSNFNVPDGGNVIGNVSNGYINTTGSIANNADGNQSWGLIDMNGDGKKDLVVFAQNDLNGDDFVFDITNSPHWKVYFNTGTQFNSSSTAWSVPSGGKIVGSVNYGFNNSAGTAVANSPDGNQSWSLFDVNGDRLPDLVVTAQADLNGEVTVLGLGSNNHWNVYLNTGSGFNTNALSFQLPDGGYILGGISRGFINTAGSAASSNDEGNMNWGMMDMNGDDRLDLVVTSQVNVNGDNVVYGFGNNPYWKVFLNTGSGFNTSVTNWSVPQGGYMNGSVAFGYNNLYASAAGNNTEGNQTWNVVDMDGDHRPDLVITAQNDLNGLDVAFGGTNPFWKVYLNTGGGFSGAVVNWRLPVGGKLTTNGTVGFNNFSGTPTSNELEGSMAWVMIDITGDGKPDLVSTGGLDLNKELTVFGLSSTPYWKLHRNNGSGFEDAVNFSVPNGGQIKGGSSYGFNTLSGFASSSTKSQNASWTVSDINGDDQVDLIVTAERVSDNGDIFVFGNGSSPFWKVYLNTAPTSGISKVATSDQWMLYPNPVSSYVSLKGTLSQKDAQYKISDAQGRIVLQGVINASGQLDVSTLPEGLWLIEINGVVKKFVKD